MDDEQSLQSLPPEQTADEEGAGESAPMTNPEAVAGSGVEDSAVDDDEAAQDTEAAQDAEAAQDTEAHADSEAAMNATNSTESAGDEADATAAGTGAEPDATEPDTTGHEGATEHNGKGNGLPRGSIAAVGERLGQRVAHVGEAAGDKVAHVGVAAGDRMHHASEVAGERVAHAGEAAGQKVILAGEAAEGTVAEAQTRAVHAKRRLAEQTGAMVARIRRSTPTPVREKGARAVQAVRRNRKAFAGSALVGIVAVIRRRGRRSGDAK